jgi:hypothetical protein
VSDFERIEFIAWCRGETPASKAVNRSVAVRKSYLDVEIFIGRGGIGPGPRELSDQTCDDRIVLIDTVTHLTRVEIDRSVQPARVKAQAGVLMQDVLARMEEVDLDWVHALAPGDLTLGGVIAIDAHGTAWSGARARVTTPAVRGAMPR